MAKPMTGRVTIAVPAAEAWAFVSDPLKVHALAPNSSVRLISGAFDKPGSRYLVTTRATGQTLDATHEIVRYEPPHLIEERTTSHGTVSRSLIQLESVADSTCVLIVQGEIEWGASFTALVGRVMTAIFGRRTFEEYLERIKEAIEAGVGASSRRDQEP